VDNAPRQLRISPSPLSASVVQAFFVDACERELPGVVMPRAETHLVVRFGPSARGGLDAHAMGARPQAYRKRIRAGQRTLMARLHLGANEAVLGAPASLLFGRIVALEDLWGELATRRLIERLGDASEAEAPAIFEQAIAERLSLAQERSSSQLVLAAAERLARSDESHNVSDVAAQLGVSERNLRRAFRQHVGVSPKAFARLARFHRAVNAAREDPGAEWGRIAADAGYYDQAHLIAEFHDLAGATPRALLDELRNRPGATGTFAPAAALVRNLRPAHASPRR
jgi:AraC-like DNA-binding protein